MTAGRAYCTYFDINYLPRGLALHGSLTRHGEPFHLWVLCLDDQTEETLAALDLPSLTTIPLAQLEDARPQLLDAKPTRSRIEYYFTLTPSLLQHVLDSAREIDRITYLDADLYFFADPAPVFDEVSDRPIAIVEHRFAPGYEHLEEFGRFNVGWLSFSRHPAAASCLSWWEDRTIEWCFDIVEEERFADQKYLDAWPRMFGDDVHVVKHLGANVAPWNLGSRRIRRRHGQVLVDDAPVIFFHFHGIDEVSRWVVDLHLRRYGAHAGRGVRRLYASYLREIRSVQEELVGERLLRRAERGPGRTIAGPRRPVIERAREKRSSLAGWLRGDRFVVRQR